MGKFAAGPDAADRAEAREDAAEALADAATSRRSATRLDVAAAVKRIEAAQQGPKTIAVFDFDGTLINGYSASVFFQHQLRRREMGAMDLADAMTAMARSVAGAIEMQDLLAQAIGKWKGKREDALEALGEKLFDKVLADKVYPEMVAILMAHRKAGHTIAIASSATRFQVEPTARFLGIEHVMTSVCEAKDGVLTGRLLEPQMWGPGKEAAVRGFVRTRKAKLADTWFYADGDEEIGLMEAVGHPVPTNPGRALAAAAKAHGWGVLRHSSRGSTTPELLTRFATGLFSLMPLLYTGFAWGMLTRDKRAGANMALPVWADSVLLASNVKLNVVGRKNLWAQRPAVFLFNHRNNFDAFFVGALVRTDLAGVGKAELKSNPITRMMAQLMPVAFVERSGGTAAEAAKALQPVTALIEQGYSIMIAPEGTRIRDMTVPLGSFKKGPFHMAMQAGVPIVPIVIRNALDVGGRDAKLMRAGTVDIAVLPPVQTGGWSAKTIDKHVAEVRQMFLDTLESWPDGD
ncbi:MAG: HAD-IB family hydrolase [Novosphingobium sp.]|nr:HAD-IB family hydrolase [Novosphingobium sp.]